MRSHLIATYDDQHFNQEAASMIAAILNNYVKMKINEDSASAQLLSLCGDLKLEESSAIRAIVDIISNLYDYDRIDMLEMHLQASIAHPFLQGLFGSKTPTQTAHCSNLMVHEKENSCTNRPDYKVDVYENYQWAFTSLFGEIKASQDATPLAKITDFHRIAIFCKDALDKQNLNNVIGVQIIGTKAAFFRYGPGIPAFVYLYRDQKP